MAHLAPHTLSFGLHASVDTPFGGAVWVSTSSVHKPYAPTRLLPLCRSLQELSAAAKKRHPAIRDTNIDTWRIAASPAQHPAGGEEGSAPYDAAAAAALAAGAPGPLEAALAPGGSLSRATSLTMAVGPLQQGVAALSRQNSDGADEAEGGEGGLAAAVAAALQHRQLPHYQSGGSSYQSAVELHSDGEADAAEEDAEAEGAAQEFAAKLNVSQVGGCRGLLQGGLLRLATDASTVPECTVTMLQACSPPTTAHRA